MRWSDQRHHPRWRHFHWGSTFANCTGLTSVTIGSGIATIDHFAFIGCSRLIAFAVDLGNPSYASQDGVLFDKQKNTLVRFPNGKRGSYSIPASVTSIGELAFQFCTGLTSVTIPGSVTSIENSAFSFCTSLIRGAFLGKAPAMGEGVFESCASGFTVSFLTWKTGFTSPEWKGYPAVALSTAPFGNFTYTRNATSITITDYPDTEVGAVTIPAIIDGKPVTSIGNNAFDYCEGLTEVIIPNSVTFIGNSAFNLCTSLTSVSVGASVAFIGEHAFSECYDLTRITIPNSVTSIGKSAFQNCQGLIDITIPNSITSIAEKTFLGCDGLTSIIIPNSVISIGESAFNGCFNLTSATIGTGLTSIGDYAFHYCDGLTGITIPNSVTSIGYWAFGNCTGLTSVTIGNGLTSIGYAAFCYCDGLTGVTIPNSVKSIDAYAFSYCEGLTRAVFLGDAPSMSLYVFDNCASTFKVSYLKGKADFTSPKWEGYPAVALGPEITVQQPVGSSLVDGTAKVGFGSNRVGKTGRIKTFRITNTGTATLSGLAITKTGPQKSSFIVSTPRKTSLAPGASTTFRVTFKPRDYGTCKGAIHIKSNDANESPFDIKLIGMGTVR